MNNSQTLIDGFFLQHDVFHRQRCLTFDFVNEAAATVVVVAVVVVVVAGGYLRMGRCLQLGAAFQSRNQEFLMGVRMEDGSLH